MTETPKPPAVEWAFSLDEEFEGNFATREEAIGAADEANEDREEDERVTEFQVGVCALVDFATFMPRARGIVEDAEEDAYSHGRPNGDALAKQPTKEALMELDAYLADWVRRHDLQCSWRDVESVETVEAGEQEEET